jgi:hypothetical protein
MEGKTKEDDEVDVRVIVGVGKYDPTKGKA